MCGIICILSNTYNNVDLLNDFLIFKENIIRRGPDLFDVKKYSSQDHSFLFAASVLWLQGKSMTKQPLEDENSIFVYNGDIFQGISESLRKEDGDTQEMHKMIQNSDEILVTLSKIHGPYAFIYFDKLTLRLYFGRDIYGRRSLLIGKRNEVLILTSVAKRTLEYDFLELPSIGIFCLDVKSNDLSIIPWQYQSQRFESKLTEIKTFLQREILIKQQMDTIEDKKFIEPSNEQLHLLNSIKGADSEKIFEVLLNDSAWLDKVLKLKNLLEEAIRQRIATQPNYCKNCIKKKIGCNHPLIGILFSGGVDCAILAALADKFVDRNRPFDLINVAFDENKNYQTPDRLTGLKTVEELKQIKPERKWNFIEMNITQKELNDERKHHIADLIYPLKSILDDSLGCALWFASRGKQETSVSSCRVLLVGMGADELFGGYTRHRAALQKQSWLGLHNMLIEDWQNLSHRNLARDDRVVSDHGRQLRTPYLDENVVEFVRNLNSWEKSYPSNELPQGVGEKMLLRSLAYYIGLKNASTFKKRALQFGSRIANKKENAHDISPRLC